MNFFKGGVLPQVPKNWRELLDEKEWALNGVGVPQRQAARIMLLRQQPKPAILLLTGHDLADSFNWWVFTPGGGLLPGEDFQTAALRELFEESGIKLTEQNLVGPVIKRASRLDFTNITCRQEETFFIAFWEDLPEAVKNSDVSCKNWTKNECDVLDSLQWWDLETLEKSVKDGMKVYPALLPVLLRQWVNGWDGTVVTINEWE